MAKFNIDKQKNSSSFTREEPTEGVQEARILRVIDMGVRRPSPKFPGGKPKQQLNFVFELSDDKVSINGEDKPMIVFYRVNLTFHEKGKFLPLAQAVGLGNEFDLEDFIGKPVALTLKKGKNTDRVFVEAVTGVSERVAKTIPELVADSYAFDFDDPDPDVLLNKLSDKMREILAEALNFPGSKVESLIIGKEVFGDPDDSDDDVGM
jgi:hypothetical protein